MVSRGKRGWFPHPQLTLRVPSGSGCQIRTSGRRRVGRGDGGVRPEMVLARREAIFFGVFNAISIEKRNFGDIFQCDFKREMTSVSSLRVLTCLYSDLHLCFRVCVLRCCRSLVSVGYAALKGLSVLWWPAFCIHQGESLRCCIAAPASGELQHARHAGACDK